jgi:hypothetical protein
MPTDTWSPTSRARGSLAVGALLAAVIAAGAGTSATASAGAGSSAAAAATTKPAVTTKAPAQRTPAPKKKTAVKKKVKKRAKPPVPPRIGDARELMSWVSTAMQVGRSSDVTVVTPEYTMVGAHTFVDHVGLEADLRLVSRVSGPSRMILVDGSAYFQLVAPIDGKRWSRVDWDSSDPDAAGWVLWAVDLSRQVDPVVGWYWYLGAMPVTTGKPVRFGATRTLPYTFRKNDQQLIADLPGREYDPDAPRFKGASARVTYYVDANGLPVRITQVVTLKNHAQLTTTTTFSHWGRAIRIPVPGASDVTRKLPPD